MKFETDRNLLSRVLCVALAALMVLGCVGCGGSGDDSSEKSIGGGEYDVVGSGDEPTLEELTEELGLPEVEITGKTVTYLNWMSNDYLTDPAKQYYHKSMLMEKYYGCKLEFITTTYEQLPTKAAQMVLSGQSPDIIFYKSADNPGFIYNNVVQPIDDYVDLSAKMFDDYKDALEELKFNGKNYFLSPSIGNNGRVIYWVQSFTDIGEKTPLELYREGKWTWSKFRELAKKLTVDANGDGTPEIYGCNYDELYIYTSCGEDFVKFNDDGTAVNNMKSAAISKAMNLLHNLGAKGDNVKGGSLTDGTCVMRWGESYETQYYGEYYQAGTMEYAPSPMMDGSDTYYVPGRINVDWLAAGAPNPGGAIAYWICGYILSESEYYKDLYDEITNGLVGYTDEQLAFNEELEDDLKAGKFVAVPSRMEGIGNWESAGMWNMLDEIAEWGTPWTTCLETYYSAFQAEIDRANEQLANMNK